MGKTEKFSGNTVGEAEHVAAMLQKSGQALFSLNSQIWHLGRAGFEIKQLKFINKDGQGGDWLCVISGRSENGAVVAFVGGDDLKSVITTLARQLRDEKLKWKDDQYANQ